MCKKEGCQSKIKKDIYGGYCFKHRNEYLTYDGIILFDRFTENIQTILRKIY